MMEAAVGDFLYVLKGLKVTEKLHGQSVEVQDFPPPLYLHPIGCQGSQSTRPPNLIYDAVGGKKINYS